MIKMLITEIREFVTRSVTAFVTPQPLPGLTVVTSDSSL
jgi:hypothetical protein